MAPSLPKFDRPPVVETVMGVQFNPIKGFRNAHLGAFWKELGEEWTGIADAPSIRPQFETFGERSFWLPPGLKLEVSSDLSVRMQVKNRAGDRMIQLQNGRLHYNWVGVDVGPVGSEYPSYDSVKPEFQNTLASFEQFLRSNQLPSHQPNQWEVTYVNHIPKGTVWNGADDLAKAFPGILGQSERLPAVRFESLSGEWHFEIPPQAGRLHLQLKHVVKPPTGAEEVAEMIVLTLTARGPVDDASDVEQGLNVGHEAIVRTFHDCVSKEAREYWRVKNADA